MTPNSKVDFTDISNLYGTNLASFGAVPSALGWKSRREQELRFHVLSQGCVGSTDPIDIIDFGCGFGDLLGFLIHKTPVVVSRYAGCEINVSIAKHARHQLRLLDSEVPFRIVESVDMLEMADWAFVSGTFNVCLDNDPEEWRLSVRETIRKLFKKTRVGLSFNALSTYVDWESAGLFYANPLEFFDFCKKELSSRVSIDHSYPLYEWTMTVRH